MSILVQSKDGKVKIIELQSYRPRDLETTTGRSAREQVDGGAVNAGSVSSQRRA